MRLAVGAIPEDVCEIREFEECILKVGDGELGEANDGEVSTDVPDELLIDVVDDPITSIKFDMTDLGALNYILGILVTRDSTDMFLSQKKYAMELLDRAHMASCKSYSNSALNECFRFIVATLDVWTPTLASSTVLLLLILIADWAGFLLLYVYFCYSCSTSSEPNTIEIDIHFVRDMVTRGQVRVLHVTSRYQYADIFTNGLSSVLFEEFRASLSIRASPAPTAGEC
ncbi:ribonuclease H-like domain-containing protein [Tanacetum coccineum]